MKKTFKLTIDHDEYDAYYKVDPSCRNRQFCLCVKGLNELFPQTNGKEQITVTVSTTKRKVKGEMEILLKAVGSEVPVISINGGENIQILNETTDTLKKALALYGNEIIYATIS